MKRVPQFSLFGLLTLTTVVSVYIGLIKLVGIHAATHYVVGVSVIATSCLLLWITVLHR